MPHVPPISLSYMMNITNYNVPCAVSDDVSRVRKTGSPYYVAGCPPRSMEQTMAVFCNSIVTAMWFDSPYADVLAGRTTFKPALKVTCPVLCTSNSAMHHQTLEPKRKEEYSGVRCHSRHRRHRSHSYKFFSSKTTQPKQHMVEYDTRFMVS